MMIRNHTPFRPLYFESRDVAGRDFGVMVLRGTFSVVDGAALRPSPEQEPILEADVWHGDQNASSLYMESDLAPFKPQTDILVNAVAHAPGGRPLPDWLVRVTAGDLTKALRVTGPRRWVRAEGGHRLSDPDPVTCVPVRYEHAFGGAWETGWRERHVLLENPVGVGYVGSEVPDEIPAPQIEDPDDPVVELGKTYRPEGLGPIPRSWQPRLGLAGTFDDAWRQSRWPALPLDFDFAHHSASHPDLRYPTFMKGDEELRLEGLTPEGSLSTYLPGYRVGLLLRYEDGSMALAAAPLDTVMLDVPLARAHLTWRSTLPKGKAIRVIEPRMTLPNGGAHG